MKKFNLVIISTFGSTVAFAQEKAPAVIPDPSIGLSVTEVLVISLLIFAIALLGVTIVLYNAFKLIFKEREQLTPFKGQEVTKPLDYEEWAKQNKNKPNIWTKLLSLKPIEQEKDIVIPHDYDGIYELNNPVPRWFNVLFYGTVIFAAGYLYYYHIGTGPQQDEEYEIEMTKAAKEKVLFLARSSEKYDESTVKVDPAMIENGKAVFMANCTACHGPNGEGLVGPNLTDEFWLHGGSINDVFKVIKYGVPDKGMTSWEKSLTSKKIAELSNYILSLQGSNPPNGKAPQGTKYILESVADTVKNETIAKN